MTNDDSSSPVDKIDRLFDAIDTMKDVYENNKDIVEDVSDSGGEISFEDKEPLTEAHLTEDSVVVVADIGVSGPLDMGVKFDDNTVTFDVGGEDFEVHVPTDVKEDTIDASITNGVLRVEMEREDTEIVNVEKVKETMEDNDTEEDNDGTSE